MNNYAVNLYVVKFVYIQWDGPGDNMTDFIDEGQFTVMDGILEIFDLTDKQSFHELEQLHENLKSFHEKIGKKMCSILVGNKADLVEITNQSN
jgi:GTPase SAR1 family protein